MAKQQFRLINAQVRQNAIAAIQNAPEGYACDIGPYTRTLAQNRMMWAALTDLSNQVMWPVNGVEQRLSPEDWKHIITASLHEENRMAQGIRGGFVMLGRSTSRMTIKQVAEVIEFAHEFGAEKGVRWSPTAIGMGV